MTKRRTLRRRSLRKSSRSLNHEALEKRELLAADVGPIETDFAASDGIWQSLQEVTESPSGRPSYLHATDFEAYALQLSELEAILATAPPEFSGDAVEITLPTPDGALARFDVVESPIMAPELADQFPEIQTFRGQSTDDAATTVRFDLTPAGLHAQVLSPEGAWYIDPYYHLDDSLYVSYFGSDTDGSSIEFHEDEIGTVAGNRGPDEGGSNPPGEGSGGEFTLLSRSGTQLRTYRLAVAATAEYTAFHSVGAPSVAEGQAAIVTAINRVTGIYENELSIRLQLVAGNNALVYTNAGTDPYTNIVDGAQLAANHANINAVIGNANYDIGHLFTTDNGGLAGLGVVGIDTVKGQGATGLPSPIGDVFFVDYVSHEIGHQFGGNHTFNGDSGACAGNRNAGTAYEPGSGSTIQAYAGICGNDDLQPNSDPYFHSISFDEMINHVDAVVPAVGVRTATGNSIPFINAGNDYTIPANTPFNLTAVGNDADVGDVLTYNWEQRDLGPQQDVNAGDDGSSPLFRSFSPTTDPTRVFPRLSDLLNNTTVVGETLPTTTRTLNFRATVRDNRSGGGGVNTDDMMVNVVNTGAGFAVTNPNTALTWSSNSTETVTWNVSGTTGNGINAANVNILLSIDGGITYPITLAQGVPNDGSHGITVPDLTSNDARCPS